MLARIARNLLRGIGLGLCYATALTAQVTLVYAASGNAPFDSRHTTYSAIVAGYYTGGIAGGVLIGACWPLRRWLLGYVVMGIVGVFPFYLFTPTAWTGIAGMSLDSIAGPMLAATFVGAGAGVWNWTLTHPDGPSWFELLRYPTRSTLIRVWLVSLLVATLSMILVPRWSYRWPFELVIAAAGLLFVVPLATAVLVTVRFMHQPKSP